MSLRITLSLLLVSILWATAFPGIKIALESFSAGHLTLLRHILASFSFLLIMLFKKEQLLPKKRDIPLFFLLGLLGYTIYHTALNFGELHVSAGTASLIIAAAPAFTNLVAFFILKDRLRLLAWLGILISFAGVVLIVLGENSEFGINIYALLVLLSAISASFYTVMQKRVLKRYSALQVTAYATWAGTIPLFLFAQGLPSSIAAASSNALLATIYIAVLPSAIAYTLFSYAISHAPVSLVTSFMYLVPVFSLLFAWLLLGEIPSVISLIGGSVAIFGVVLVNRFKNKS